MESRFIGLARAGDFSYCRPYCAKCYFRFVRDFITPVEMACGALPEGGFPSGMWWHEIMALPGVQNHLADELESVPLSELLQLNHWDGHLTVAFTMLRGSDLPDRILRRWLETCPDNPRLVDVLIFYVLPLATDSEIRHAWLAKAANLAVASEDHSLVESLVRRLGGGLDKYPELLNLATELQKTSPHIAKAMHARIHPLS